MYKSSRIIIVVVNVHMITTSATLICAYHKAITKLYKERRNKCKLQYNISIRNNRRANNGFNTTLSLQITLGTLIYCQLRMFFNNQRNRPWN